MQSLKKIKIEVYPKKEFKVLIKFNIYYSDQEILEERNKRVAELEKDRDRNPQDFVLTVSLYVHF